MRLVRVIVMVVFVAHGQWPGVLVRMPWNKSNGGVRWSKIKVDLLVERLLERIDAQKEDRQIGVFLEDGQGFGGLRHAFALESAWPRPGRRRA